MIEYKIIELELITRFYLDNFSPFLIQIFLLKRITSNKYKISDNLT